MSSVWRKQIILCHYTALGVVCLGLSLLALLHKYFSASIAGEQPQNSGMCACLQGEQLLDEPTE